MPAHRKYDTCQEPNCTAPHFALAKCKSHYRRARYAAGKDGARGTKATTTARAYVNGERRRVVCEVLRSPGESTRVWGTCPDCGYYLGCRSEVDRYCRECGTQVTILDEDLALIKA